MLKYPKSPLADVLVVGLLDDDIREDTTSVTVGSECPAGVVAACSTCGRAGVAGVPKKLREGTRSQDGIDGIPTVHPPPLADADKGADPWVSVIEADVDGGYVW